MDYIIGIIVAVLLMSIAWTSPDQSIGSKSFYSDILTGVLYFIAFSIGSTIAGALFKALLIVYAYASTWVGAMIAERSVAGKRRLRLLSPRFFLLHPGLFHKNSPGCVYSGNFHK